MVETGLDRLHFREYDRLNGRPYGILCNQATITRDCRHILELPLPPGLKAIFGPQHGLYGHTQDNMIEWEGSTRGLVPIHSLYGQHRKPTPEMLQGIDLLVVDLPDIGSRYYTFAWTTVLAIEACQEAGVDVLILDRPNPLGGIVREGPVNEIKSFVGLRPVPIRHGLTLGEIARSIKDDVQIEEATGWRREDLFPATGLTWAMPSPNMPTFETALVYPGGCLLEGTTVSEGRGTTRPFEIFGDPEFDSAEIAAALNELSLPGVHFRPIEFQPTFNKHEGQICRGCFVHVTDAARFQPVRTYAHILHESYRRKGGDFWKQPPYEYEYEISPIDLLWGSPWLREAIQADDLVGLDEQLVKGLSA